MNPQIRKGLGFGLTSGVITTLGLIVGLDASTGSRLAVIAGILVIAVADALSDAMGIHIAEESTNKKTQKQIWEATISTFFFKFVFALTFAFPFLFFSLSSSVVICILWGLFLITVYSHHLAQKTKIAAYKVICEHLVLTVFVIAAAYFIGKGAAMLI
ncbi:hypothetical protein KY310_00735 [Candidatus Woesearchaeota archaeon]|nr:hypothetical protein [Candidatus Woesearchaeota archaeon]